MLLVVLLVFLAPMLRYKFFRYFENKNVHFQQKRIEFFLLSLIFSIKTVGFWFDRFYSDEVL